jgi:uncharacterized protein (TIGR02217 family)
LNSIRVSKSGVSRRSRSRRRYDVSYGVKSYEQLSQLIAFYISRKGPAAAFRFKDWSDFTSAEVGKDAAAFTDQTIGVGDGTTTQFQLVKRYQSGSQTETRRISNPVADTTQIGVNGERMSSGFTVDSSTGLVTFTVAPTLGHPITAGFEFDVPVRFGAEVDEALTLTIESFSSGSMEAIPVIEVFDGEQYEDDYFYGGAIEHGNISADISISQPNGRVQSYNPQTGGLTVYLPAKSNVKPGGPIFYLHNLSGSNAISIKEAVSDGGATVLSHAADSSLTINLSINDAGDTRTWFAF